MIDLAKQKTFEFNPITRVWCSNIDNFVVYKSLDGNSHLMYLDETYGEWENACQIASLEQLEKEYNKRSNNLFEWK